MEKNANQAREDKQAHTNTHTKITSTVRHRAKSWYESRRMKRDIKIAITKVRCWTGNTQNTGIKEQEQSRQERKLVSREFVPEARLLYRSECSIPNAGDCPRRYKEVGVGWTLNNFNNAREGLQLFLHRFLRCVFRFARTQGHKRSAQGGAVSRANVEYKWVLEAVLPYHFVALNINFCSSRVLVFEQLAALDLMRADIGRQMRRLERDALEMGCSLRLCGLLKTIA